MAVSGLGNPLAGALSQYNFRSMTNGQFLAAVRTLGGEGRISKADADQLSMIAQGVDSVPITGASPPVSRVLSDPTPHDFVSELEGDDRAAQAPGAIGGALYDHLLAALRSVGHDVPTEDDRSGSA